MKAKTLSEKVGAPVSVVGRFAWISTELPRWKREKLTPALALASGGKQVDLNVILP